MEESVTRKFVHEESSTVTALCSKSPLLYAGWPQWRIQLGTVNAAALRPFKK